MAVIPSLRATSSFNPRLRAGGESLEIGRSMERPVVSIHASAREASRASPRLQARSAVSIHASAREARWPGCQELLCGVVSIHASAREASVSIGWRRIDRRCFNPRLRAGGEAAFAAGGHQAGSFNPRLRAGGESRAFARRHSVEAFQSTPPRGRRV